MKILLEEVWRSLPRLLIGDLWGSLRSGLCARTSWCSNVYACICVCVLKTAEWLRQRWRRELIRNRCLCFLCLGLVLEMKGSGGGGVGAGAWIFIRVSPHAVEGLQRPYYGWVRWAQLSQSALKNSSAATTSMAPIRTVQANIQFASQRRILIKVSLMPSIRRVQ